MSQLKKVYITTEFTENSPWKNRNNLRETTKKLGFLCVSVVYCHTPIG
jgi:hypothetical protein